MEQIIKHFTPPPYTAKGTAFIEFAYSTSDNAVYKAYRDNLINQFLKESGVIAKIEQIKTVNESLADKAYIKQKVARLLQLYNDWAHCVLKTCHLLMYENQGKTILVEGKYVNISVIDGEGKINVEISQTYKTFNQVIVRALQCHQEYYHLIEQTVDEQYPTDIDFTQADFGIQK